MSEAVEQALDAFWRSFPPIGSEGYQRERSRLLSMRRAADAEGAKQDLLQIDSALVTLADNFGEVDDVIAFARNVLAQREHAAGETTAATLFLLRALHTSRRHDEEIDLASSVAIEPAMPSEDVVRVLEPVLHHHRGELRWSETLREKVRDASHAEAFAGVPDEKKGIPENSRHLDEFVLMLAHELRKWNEQMMSHVTGDE